MKSTRPANQLELTDSETYWLHEAIGFNDLRDDVRKTKDYARTIEHHLDDNVDFRLNAKNSDGNTALHLVAISQNYNAIEALLLCGADVNLKNDLGHTPITYSHHCTDYNVGFQFFRHLHKLRYLGQHICPENHAWKYDVCRIYEERYASGGYLAAFTNDRKRMTEDAIGRIRRDGEHAVRQMYAKELRKMREIREGQARSLHQLASAKGEKPVEENRLEELKNRLNDPNFDEEFPLFGCVIRRKYREAYERAKNREQAASRECDRVDYARNLRDEEERSMREFVAREDTVVTVLMKEVANIRRTEERRGATVEKRNAETSDDEQVERMRKMLAKLSRPGLRS